MCLQSHAAVTGCKASMCISMVSIELLTPWFTKAMHLEEFPSIRCVFLSMQFSKCTCLRWDVLASFTHLEPETGFLVIPALLTGTQLLIDLLCPLLSHNAEIM